MTDGTAPSASDDQLRRWLERIDLGLHQGFRTTRQRTEDGFTGRDFHIATLHASHDFYEWEDFERFDEVWADMELALDAVTAALEFRWGPAETMQLWPFLKSLTDEGADHGPEVIHILSTTASDMRYWLPPGYDRFVALAVGQQDKELPSELTVAVGLRTALQLGGSDATIPGS
jgi:hypothetical protein